MRNGNINHYATDLPAHKPSCIHFGHLVHDDDTCECAR